MAAAALGGLGRPAQGPWWLLEPPPHPHLHTTDSHSLRLTSASHTHLRTGTQILVFQLTDTFRLSSVCVREHAPAKQSRLSVARGLWRQICLNAFIVSRGGRDAEREMWRRAEGRRGLPRRTGTCTDVAAAAPPSPLGSLRSCRRRPFAPTSRFETPLASIRGGEAPAADQRQEEKNPCNPAAAAGVAHGPAEEGSSIAGCVALT